jgi:hypothetical protein
MNDLTFTVRALLAAGQQIPDDLVRELCDRLDASIPDPLMDWSDAPDHAMWATRDRDGDMFYFSKRPRCVDGVYIREDGRIRGKRYEFKPRMVERPGT